MGPPGRVGALAVVLTIGCNPLATIGFLTYKDPVKPAKYPLVSKEGPKKDKEEIKVALFVSQGSGQSFEFAGAEATIASEMARVIPELAKENKQKVVVIKPADVNKFKMINYGNLTILTVVGGDASNVFNIVGTAFNVPLAIRTGAGATEIVNVGSAHTTLASFLSLMTILGQGASNTLNILDQGDTTGQTYNLSDGHVSDAVAINFGEFNNLTVNGGSAYVQHYPQSQHPLHRSRQ